MQIRAFSEKLSEGMGKVVERFVEEMLYGLQAKGSVRLSETARSLVDKASVKKRIDRLSRNLGRVGLGDAIGRGILAEGASRIKGDTLLILDPNFDVFGVSMRELFQVRPYNLSVAVWVGFLALFGIATNDGVIYSTYLDQVFARHTFTSLAEIRAATVEAGMKRVRPALMTTATTILALIPVLTSQGKGADVMAPMALPSFGGMCIDMITIFVVPNIYCLVKELEFKRKKGAFGPEQGVKP